MLDECSRFSGDHVVAVRRGTPFLGVTVRSAHIHPGQDHGK